MQRADRRRLAFATALTLAVLPAIWLANRDQDGVAAPNVAAVGLPTDDGSGDTPTADAGVQDPMGRLAPRFLTDSAGAATAPPDPTVVVGSTDDALVGTGTATYRSDVGPAGACLYNGVAMGELVTIVNVDNGRSVECWTGPNLDEDAPPDELVLTPARLPADRRPDRRPDPRRDPTMKCVPRPRRPLLAARSLALTRSQHATRLQ